MVTTTKRQTDWLSYTHTTDKVLSDLSAEKKNVNQTFDVTESKEDPDLAIWIFMKDIVEELGFDGMSSDDMDIEDYQPIYWARNLPWRWQGVTSILDIFDQERTLPGLRGIRICAKKVH